jgi:hypothetical protein
MKIKYREGYKYQLAETYSLITPVIGYQILDPFYVLQPNGYLIIKEGYAWDGASGPTIDTKNSMRPSLVHDVFCQAQRAGQINHKYWSHTINKFFEEMCIADGMLGIRASLWRMAVDLADAGNPEQGVSNPVQEAP